MLMFGCGGSLTFSLRVKLFGELSIKSEHKFIYIAIVINSFQLLQ